MLFAFYWNQNSMKLISIKILYLWHEQRWIVHIFYGNRCGWVLANQFLKYKINDSILYRNFNLIISYRLITEFVWHRILYSVKWYDLNDFKIYVFIRNAKPSSMHHHLRAYCFRIHTLVRLACHSIHVWTQENDKLV